MKKIMIVILLISLISGCKIMDIYYNFKLKNMELFYIDADINSLEDVGAFMTKNVIYKSDGLISDVWSTPEETFEKGYGDCEDLTLLFINLTYTHLNLKFNFVAVDNRDRKIISGGFVNHAEPYYNGESYNIFTAKPKDQTPICFIYSFDSIFNEY